MTMPANIRVTALFNFPAGVQATAPLAITKANGIYTISYNYGGIAINAAPAPANYPTDYVVVYDSLGLNSFLMPLSSFATIVAGGQAEDITYTVRGVNFNAANTDTPIVIALPKGVTNYQCRLLRIANASQTLTTANFGVFTGAGGTGIAVVTAATAITVSTAAANTNNNSQTVTVDALNATRTLNAATLFFRVGTAQGAPATGDIILSIVPC